jgi:high frequency lysogenization protein
MVRYVFNLLYLERKFAANSEMMAVVHSRLQHASFKAEHFSGHVHEVCQSVSGIYQDTLSQLRFRIKVNGSAQHLQDKQNADIIRALLLAGLRSAFLWRQLGGRRWKLLLQRKQILETAQKLSRNLPLV